MKTLSLLFFGALFLVPVFVAGQMEASCYKTEGVPFAPLTIDRHKIKTILEGEVEISFGAKGSNVVSNILNLLLKSADGGISGRQTQEYEPVFVGMNQAFNTLSCMLYRRAVVDYNSKMLAAGLTSSFKQWWDDDTAKRIASEADSAYVDALFAAFQEGYSLPDSSPPESPSPRISGPGNFPVPRPLPTPKGIVPATDWKEDCTRPAKVTFSEREVKVFVPCESYASLVVEYWAGPKAARPFRSLPLATDLKPIHLARDRFANPNNSLIVKVYGLPQSIHGKRTFLGEFQE